MAPMSTLPGSLSSERYVINVRTAVRVLRGRRAGEVHQVAGAGVSRTGAAVVLLRVARRHRPIYYEILAADDVAPAALVWERQQRPGMEPGLEAGPWRLKHVPAGWLLYHRVPACGGPLWQRVRARPFASPSEASAFIASGPEGTAA